MITFPHEAPIFAMVGATVALAFAIAYSIKFKRTKQEAIPTKWVAVGKVKKLIIYPLKSARRRELETAICTKYGLMENKLDNLCQLRDRNFVIFKEDMKQSYVHSKILLIETTAYDEKHVILKAPCMDPIIVQIPQTNCDNGDTVTLWFLNEKLNTTDCGDEVAKWLSQFILGQDRGLRMGYSKGQKRGNVPDVLKTFIKFYPRLVDDTKGIYSYSGSYHLLSQASVDDINSRVTENITEHNFRPNVLVEGVDQYAEDDWIWIKIGDVIFYHVMHVARCFVTTYNPENAQKHSKYEPINTLRKYRLVNGKARKVFPGVPTLGVHLGTLNDEGSISVGDTVYVGKT